MKFVFFILSILITSSVEASEFELIFPLDCKLGQNCIIQNYVDIDKSNGRKDYNCGFLTYDGHKGTDFRIKDYKMMKKGVKVFAVADGQVLRVRNIVSDRKYGEDFFDYIKKIGQKHCGNGVYIKHEKGFESQYCHMKKSSITVKKGDKVKAGDFLGYVGMSGKTEFPHLHITFRKKGQLLAPFVGKCKKQGRHFWKNKMPYTNTKIFKSGFLDYVPSLSTIEKGGDEKPTIFSKALLYWVNVVGIQKGDVQEITIAKPDGSVLAKSTNIIMKKKVNWLSYVGKRRPKTGWKKGVYTATYSLKRGDRTIAEEIKKLEMNM